MDLCLRGGRVIDPGRGVDAEADLILKDGVVARSGKGIAGELMPPHAGIHVIAHSASATMK